MKADVLRLLTLGHSASSVRQLAAISASVRWSHQIYLGAKTVSDCFRVRIVQGTSSSSRTPLHPRRLTKVGAHSIRCPLEVMLRISGRERDRSAGCVVLLQGRDCGLESWLVTTQRVLCTGNVVPRRLSARTPCVAQDVCGA